MFASLIVYLGLIVAGVGAVSVLVPLAFLGIRRRRTGLLLAAGGVLVVLVGFVLPAREARVRHSATLLDDFAPTYQFHEIHTARVRASSAQAYRAIRSVTADEIALFRALTWIRRLGRPGPESIVNAPGKRPILDVAMKSSFLLLAEQPGREIVLGTAVVAPRGWRPRGVPTPEGFRTLRAPGFAMATMNFHVKETAPGLCTVVTETRVFATDAATCRSFAVYWRIIYPGSALIRHMWLRAVKRRAEDKRA